MGVKFELGYVISASLNKAFGKRWRSKCVILVLAHSFETFSP